MKWVAVMAVRVVEEAVVGVRVLLIYIYCLPGAVLGAVTVKRDVSREVAALDSRYKHRHLSQ